MRVEPGVRALVTGASKGIGRATAEALAARGARVGLVARGEDELAALAADLPGDPVVLPADVSSRESIEAAVERFIEEAGGIELLVANAGLAHYGPFFDQPIENAEEMVRVNVLGTIYTVGAALGPHARPRPRPRRRRLVGRRPPGVSVGGGLRRDQGRRPRLRRGAAPRAVGDRSLGDDRLPGRGRERPALPPARQAPRLAPRREHDPLRAASPTRSSRPSRTTAARSSSRRRSARSGSTGSLRGSPTASSPRCAGRPPRRAATRTAATFAQRRSARVETTAS